MMSFLRHIATKVLFIVLASWMLAVLQPCCEAIASTLPHDHGLPQEVHHLDQEHSTTSTGGVTNHQHCDTADKDIGKIPALISENIQSNNFEPKPDVLAVLSAFPGNRSSVAAPGLLTFHPPPPGRYNRVYLQTQRLRI